MPSTAQYKYPDGSVYTGEWSDEGQKHGRGTMVFPDGARYIGEFSNGLSSGCGALLFKDGSRYEGDFVMGKFAGYGIFCGADGMRFEGEFKDGKVWGQGRITFADGTHGLPRNEGHFEGGRLTRREQCGGAVQRARQQAERARTLAQLHT